MPSPKPSKQRGSLFGVLDPLKAFLRLEAASGILLLFATIVALVWANSPWSGLYERCLQAEVVVGIGRFAEHFTVAHFINDGLMCVFFFVVGMEIKRELKLGELRTPRTALLPAIAALGGVIVPAGIYALLNAGTAGMKGWAIPMATDIAFCVGILTLLKARVPHALIVFITALAIFDDILGIAVIAMFYGKGLQRAWLTASAALITLVVFLGKRGVLNAGMYVVAGMALWFTVHSSGVHVTIAGVLLGLAVPAFAPRPVREVLRELGQHATRLSKEESSAAATGDVLVSIEERLEELEPPLDRFIHALHGAVAFVIIPVFALANAGVDMAGFTRSDFFSRVSVGTATGLFVGKQLGIFTFVILARKMKVGAIPGAATGRQLYGVSVVAGIGFTVALFIATLAFASEPVLLNQAKIGVVAGSLASGLVGTLVLSIGRRRPTLVPAGVTGSGSP